MKEYFFSDGLSKHGPFTLEELKERKLSRNTMVWKHPMEKWIPAEELPELQDYFSTQPPEMGGAGRPERPVVQRNYEPEATRPRTWLVESILVTIFCCLPFGIAGIVNAARVESRFNCGDVAGARRSSEEAGKWTKIGFWIGVASIVLYFIFLAFVIAIDH
ncbi:CD225/dispanin family protein [Salinimicrobium soli]|uniref:CD225/dispanin family protein n=1 Tax=Salinimicrobium soli TaxID=1254399 RepID=UPI003AACDA6F